MDIKKPLIRQAGSAEAFVDSTATGREHKKYRPNLVRSQAGLKICENLTDMTLDDRQMFRADS